MMYVDLAEIDELLSHSRLWSTWRFAPACFRRADYFSFVDNKHVRADTEDLPPGTLPPVDECVRSAVEYRLGFRPEGPIRVLTNLRYFGYLINPISCYYCLSEKKDELEALLIEVTNTPWGQRTYYVLDLRDYEAGQRLDFNKDMHVSPFMPMNMMYRWTGMLPGKQLRYTLASFKTSAVGSADAGDDTLVRDDTHTGDECGSGTADHLVQGGRQFDSGVNLSRTEISSRSLNGVLLRYPWMTAKVAAAIYWQALKLWLKRIPFVPHPDKADGIRN